MFALTSVAVHVTSPPASRYCCLSAAQLASILSLKMLEDASNSSETFTEEEPISIVDVYSRTPMPGTTWSNTIVIRLSAT